MNNVARGKEIQNEIRRVLLSAWDPIGVRDEPNAESEYDSYIAGVYRLIASGAAATEVVAHLHSLEHGMGFNETDETALLPVAEMLRSLDVRLTVDRPTRR